jgi:hypothetical protein
MDCASASDDHQSDRSDSSVTHLSLPNSADFLVVPTATYRLLFVPLILAHERRRVVNVAVTAHPTAAWTAPPVKPRGSGRSWPTPK